jgi:hypothetical protein
MPNFGQGKRPDAVAVVIRRLPEASEHDFLNFPEPKCGIGHGEEIVWRADAKNQRLQVEDPVASKIP